MGSSEDGVGRKLTPAEEVAKALEAMKANQVCPARSDGAGWQWREILVLAGLARSLLEADRLIKEGAVRVRIAK